MKGIVDRFENNFVIIEIAGVTQDIPIELLDSNVQVNDTVELVDGIWRKNELVSVQRQEKIKKLMDSVWEE